jgi:hypothetical protein
MPKYTKCPNCGSSYAFNPETQNCYACDWRPGLPTSTTDQKQRDLQRLIELGAIGDEEVTGVFHGDQD